MKRFIYKYLIILVILISILVYIVSARYDIESKTHFITDNNILQSNVDHIVERKEEYQISKIIDLNNIYPFDKMYKVQNANVYSLSYHYDGPGEKLKVGSNLKLSDYASDAITIILRESYPNITLEEMGVETPEEAYLAVQLAIWDVGYRTGTANFSSEFSKLESIKEAYKKNNISDKVFNKASELIDLAESYVAKSDNSDWTLSSTFFVKTHSVVFGDSTDGEYYMVGPYNYGVESGILTSLNVVLQDENGQPFDGKIVDNYGIEIKDFLKTNEIHVKFKKRKAIINVIFKVEAITLTPSVYIDEYGRDYIVDAGRKGNIDSKTEIEIY